MQQIIKTIITLITIQPSRITAKRNNMTTTKYYVAKAYETMLPTIVEAFNSEPNAQAYADILSKEKGIEYIVLEVK